MYINIIFFPQLKDNFNDLGFVTRMTYRKSLWQQRMAQLLPNLASVSTENVHSKYHNHVQVML